MISNRFYRNSDKKLISKMGEDTAILLEIVKQRFFKNSGLSAVFIQGNCPISAEIFCSKLCDLWPTIEIVISRKLDHAGDLYKFLIIFLPCINDTNLQTSVAFTQLSNLCSDRFNFKNLKINPVSSKDFEMIFTKNYKLLKFSEFLVNINFAVATNYDYVV
ncbi:hypothetical protein EON73_00830 [bacterium]|nr:MAG: hypothetical protein EON73_00830 [bacterium]